MLRLFILSSIFTVVACSSPPDNRSSADAGTDKLPNTGLSQSTKDAASLNETLSFAPSNLAGIVFSNANSVKIDGQCTFDTDAGSVDCDSDEAIQFHVVTQSDANRTEVGVFVAESLTIGPDAVVTVVGTRPIAIVTRGEILIQGSLQAIPNLQTGNGGGFSSPSITAADLSGKGPGGGGAPTGNVGGGGGAYCGKGGNTNGGQPYGNAAIFPLMGGSSGAVTGNFAGPGGGAVQLVSGSSITLAPLAKINVGGGGGEWLGGGGGSGGAVLLEAPTVTVQGVIAANGGSGGENSLGGAGGYTGTPNATAAPGGTNPSTPSENPGGSGSAGSIIDGSAGQYTNSIVGISMGAYGGGGGGGAGRIRINTSSGSASITGVLSPSAGTSCVSQGKLLPSG